MKKSDDKFVSEERDAVEALLGQARPRPVPAAANEQIVREAVHAEWRAVTGRRSVRRRALQFAAAAAIVLALAVGANLLKTTGVRPVEVATIDKQLGSVYVLGQQSELLELQGLDDVSTGQTIITAQGAGLGLTWGRGQGSLRIDEGTRVTFVDRKTVYLQSGQLYFDSQAPRKAVVTATALPQDFVIQTDYGKVSHLGTQYMTTIKRGALVVSVREGEVEIDRRSGKDNARAGQRLEIVGDARASVTNIRRSGALWDWVESVAPTLDFSGQSTYDFLQWVGRETGCEVVFQTAGAEQVARQGLLVGSVPNVDPRRELEIRMLGEDLDYAFDDDAGTLNVQLSRQRM